MKKLNKLLMPVVGLSTIAATAIPLAACSKYTDGVKVSEDEWNDALAYISANKEGATWKSSGEDVVSEITFSNGTVSRLMEFYNFAFNDNYANADLVEYFSGKAVASTWWSILQDSQYFTYAINTETEVVTTGGVSPVSLITVVLTEGIMNIGGRDSYKFDDSRKLYTFNEETKIEESPAYVLSNVKFDSNKKITYVNYHAVVFNEDKSQVTNIVNVELHPQYDNVKVEVNEKLVQRAKRHNFTLPENNILNITSLKSTDEKDDILLNLKRAIKTNATLKFSAEGLTSNLFSSVILTTKDAILEQNTDYKIAGNDIQFLKDFTEEDNVQVIYVLNESTFASNKLTFQLTGN